MIAVVFALFIGVALGMLGGGGSILTVPVFTYVAGLDPKVAIASSLPVVAIISAFGAYGHWRAGNTEVRTALLFGAFAMVGGFSGARAAAFLSGTTQLLLFAVVMLIAAASMLRGRRTDAETEQPRANLPLAKLAPLGLGVGVLTGLVGVGGGFMIVPALAQIGGVPMRRAIGTSLMIIALNASASTAGYLGQVSLPFTLLIPFTLVALVGIALGTNMAQRVPQQSLKRAFAVLLFLVGGFILYQNRSILPIISASATASTRPLALGEPLRSLHHVLQTVL